eukprot:m.218726 g.218726  ORF g.218726 m.218726 type:complete len:103 (+) comp10790_c1_seq1:1149-1457(+)
MPAFLPPPPLDLKRSSVPNVDYSFNSEYSCRRQSIESVESAQSDESWLGDDEVDPMLWQQPFPSQVCTALSNTRDDLLCLLLASCRGAQPAPSPPPQRILTT